MNESGGSCEDEDQKKYAAGKNQETYGRWKRNKTDKIRANRIA